MSGGQHVVRLVLSPEGDWQRGCLSRLVGGRANLERRVSAQEEECSARRATIDWQFSNWLACVKLKKLYLVVTSQLG